MTSRDFCYWLQGFFEVGHPIVISGEQTATIKAHLAMVFRHEIDPSHGNPEYIEELRKIHEGGMDKARRPEEGSPPDGAPVSLDPTLTGLLPADWIAKLPKGGGGSFNC